MHFIVTFAVAIVSGLYTSLWGAFKDSPYENFKPGTFPRSVYFNIAILLPLYFVPYFRDNFQHLGLVQIFFLIMGIERFLAELYKGFFRTEDQDKYFVPSRITFFGRYVDSNLLRYAVGTLIVALVFGMLLIEVPSRRMSPWVAVSNPASIIRQVVLPEPDGPSMVRNSPFGIERLRSLTTSVSPS